MKTVHLIISGKVQGVFFRARSKNAAEKFKIKGWIRNTNEGKVEAIVTGEPDNVNEFIKWCKKGPENARVKDVTVSEKPELEFERFEVI